jgi:hypothetical protein
MYKTKTNDIVLLKERLSILEQENSTLRAYARNGVCINCGYGKK